MAEIKRDLPYTTTDGIDVTNIITSPSALGTIAAFRAYNGGLDVDEQSSILQSIEEDPDGSLLMYPLQAISALDPIDQVKHIENVASSFQNPDHQVQLTKIFRTRLGLNTASV